MGFSPGQVCCGFSVTKGIDSKTLFGVKGLYPTLFPGGRSVTRIPFLRASLYAASQYLLLGPSVCTAVLWAPLSAQPSSGPLCTVVPHSCSPGLCPWHCHCSSLCSALLQPCSPATVSPRALGGALYMESITTHCPHVYSEPAKEGQVRILATGTLISSTLAQPHGKRNSLTPGHTVNRLVK